LGQSQVLLYVRGISQSGPYKFTLISFEKKDAFEKLGESIKKMCEERNIDWYPLEFKPSPPILSTFFSLRRMRALAFRLHRRNNFSLVHCRAYLTSFIGLELRRKFKIPYLFDMRGFWPDERIDGGLWNLKNPIYRQIFSYFKRNEKAFLQESQHIVSLTEIARKEIYSWNLQPPPAPISIIPCCVDFELFDPLKITESERQEAYDTLNIPEGSRIVTYLGSLGTWYNLNGMMEFVKIYQNHNYHETFFVILTGEPESLVMNSARQTNFDIRFLRIVKVPRTKVPAYISLSTFSIFFYNSSYSRKATSPVKLGELMAMGIPIVCNDGIGDTTEIVIQNQAGVVVDNFDHGSYKRAVEKLNQGGFDPTFIRRSAREIFSLNRGVELYKNIYDSLTDAI
jgi:glycosyltransferase involved in cell wall biosynthesis